MLKRLIVATAAAATLGVVGLPAISHAQEAPAPIPVPCAIDNWLERRMRDSDAVRCLQQTFTNLQIPTGPVDGYLGPITQGAIRAYQESKGITVDGEVGPETAAALGAEAVTYTGPAEDPTPDVVVRQTRRSTSTSSSSARSSSQSSGRSSGGGSSSGGSSGASGVNWDRVAQCESGQQWGHGQVTNRYGTFSGGLMIMNSAWRQFGGQEFAPTAGQ